jgi:hypothetical protein
VGHVLFFCTPNLGITISCPFFLCQKKLFWTGVAFYTNK